MQAYPVWTHHTLALMTGDTPHYIARQVTEWRKKWRLIKLKRWVYVPSDTMQFLDTMTLSRWLVDPSYVSCERAMHFYGMIPESVHITTCVTPKKTQQYDTSVWEFSYRYLASKYYRWWEQIDQIYIATPEKALLDYCWLYQESLHDKSIESLRLHFPTEFSSQRFLQYMQRRNKKSFSKKLSLSIIPYLPDDWSTS